MSLGLAPQTDRASSPSSGLRRAGRIPNVFNDFRSRAPITSAAICVPARNEAARLPEFFAALREAVRHAVNSGLSCEVVVALDGCTDASPAIVDAQSLSFVCPVRAVHLPPIGTPHAGRARRAAMDEGLHPGTQWNREGHALMTTDADTRVDRDWITANADGLRDTDVVAGWVDWDTETALPELIAQERYFSDLHLWRRTVDPVAHDAPDPHHKQYGASLAVRADVYASLGGLPERPHNEDTALVRAARLAGFRVRQDRRPRVLTSTRKRGRASHGFADAITSVEAMRADGIGLEVDCPDYLTESYRASARARRAWTENRDAVGARGVCGHPVRDSEDSGHRQPDIGATRFRVEDCVGTDLPEFEFHQAWAGSSSADAFVTRLFEPLVPGPKVPLERAVHRLEQLKERGL